ncbi:MAG: GIY-YIG nuclease family protein [Desulfohalobiaceae bacterium]
MPFTVYILHSRACDRFYCGQTDDLEKRVRQHNDPDYTYTCTTKRFPGPWELVWHAQLASRTEALILERKIKKRGIGRFLQGQDGC